MDDKELLTTVSSFHKTPNQASHSITKDATSEEGRDVSPSRLRGEARFEEESERANYPKQTSSNRVPSPISNSGLRHNDTLGEGKQISKEKKERRKRREKEREKKHKEKRKKKDEVSGSKRRIVVEQRERDRKIEYKNRKSHGSTQHSKKSYNNDYRPSSSSSSSRFIGNRRGISKQYHERRNEVLGMGKDLLKNNYFGGEYEVSEGSFKYLENLLEALENSYLDFVYLVKGNLTTRKLDDLWNDETANNLMRDENRKLFKSGGRGRKERVFENDSLPTFDNEENGYNYYSSTTTSSSSVNASIERDKKHISSVMDRVQKIGAIRNDKKPKESDEDDDGFSDVDTDTDASGSSGSDDSQSSGGRENDSGTDRSDSSGSESDKSRNRTPPKSKAKSTRDKYGGVVHRPLSFGSLGNGGYGSSNASSYEDGKFFMYSNGMSQGQRMLKRLLESGKVNRDTLELWRRAFPKDASAAEALLPKKGSNFAHLNQLVSSLDGSESSDYVHVGNVLMQLLMKDVLYAAVRHTIVEINLIPALRDVTVPFLITSNPSIRTVYAELVAERIRCVDSSNGITNPMSHKAERAFRYREIMNKFYDMHYNNVTGSLEVGKPYSPQFLESSNNHSHGGSIYGNAFRYPTSLSQGALASLMTDNNYLMKTMEYNNSVLKNAKYNTNGIGSSPLMFSLRQSHMH